MKKLGFSMLFLLGSASAVQLYNVNVQISPARKDASMYLTPVDARLKKYICSTKDFKAEICKLPAGKYDLSIYTSANSFTPPADKVITISKNTSIKIPVKIVKGEPFFTAEGRAAFKYVFDAVDAKPDTFGSCSGAYEYGETLCAISESYSGEEIIRLFNLAWQFKRQTDWKTVVTTKYADFLVFGKYYRVSVLGGTFRMAKRL